MFALVIVGAAMFFGIAAGADSPTAYPQTKRIDHTDEYHGTVVADPYRWLEDDVRNSADVREWVDAQNKVTFAFLHAIPERKRIQERLTQLWNYARYSAPTKAGGKYFFSKNDGLQNQAVYYMLDNLNAEPKVLLDPNTWSKDGTVALAGVSISDDAKYVAYGVAESGSDWHTWRVLDVATGKPLADELKWVKFSGIAWTKDGKGFYYGCYDEPKKGDAFQGLNRNQRLMYHRVGTPQSEDALAFKRPDHPDWGFMPRVSDDGRYLVITIWQGTDDRYRVVYRDLQDTAAQPVELINHFNDNYSFIDNAGPVFYFRTDLNAARGRVIAIDTRKPQTEHWQDVIAQTTDNLVAVDWVGDQLIATYLHDAHTRVKVFSPAGKLVRDIEFPGLGTASGFSGRKTDTETFYSFSSFDTPPSIFRFDLLTGVSSLFRQSAVAFQPNDFEVKQVFCRNKDGTKVPMFITAKKGLKLDGNNPTLLYGYGGFNVPLTPQFSTARIAWLEMGGVLAIANLRGGGEYGKDWHKAGTKLQKQNVFDDFIAAAEFLISEKYTRSDRLAIQGGSNGGLLVGACMVQRPELFGACIPAVGVMDMLRFHKFTAGRFWVDDYGSADNPEEFKALYAYSPYHNLKKGVKYPPTLVTTADTDDRVVPGHSFKFTAMLQYCQDGPAPVMARIETKAGHGAGKPTAKLIEEAADVYAFLVKTLKISLPVK
jgi:prolyl oligopeptidase